MLNETSSCILTQLQLPSPLINQMGGMRLIESLKDPISITTTNDNLL